MPTRRRRLLPTLVLLASVISLKGFAAHWAPIPVENAPPPRGDFFTGVIDGKAIVWGGQTFDGKTWTARNDGGIYDLATGTWKAMSTDGAPTPTDTVVRFPAAVVGKKLIVWGGKRGGRESTLNWVSTGSMYDLDSDTWTPITNVGAPSGRTGHLLIPAGDKLIVWGGWRAKNGRTATGPDDGAIFDPKANTWEAIPPLSIIPTQNSYVSLHYFGAWTGSELVIINGELGDGRSSARMAKYNPATRQWSELDATNAPWNTELYENSAWTAVIGDKLFYGLNVYDLSSHAWSSLDASFYLDDYGTGLGASSKRLYLFAFNARNSDVRHRELWTYSPDRGQLERQTDTAHTPNNAFYKMAVIGETPLIFGRDLTTAKFVGWIYE